MEMAFVTRLFPRSGLSVHAVVGAQDGSALPPKDHLSGAMTFDGYIA